MYPRSAKEQSQGEGGGRTQGTLVGGWVVVAGGVISPDVIGTWLAFTLCRDLQ